MEELFKIYKERKSKKGYEHYIWLLNKNGNYMIFDKDAKMVSNKLKLPIEFRGNICYLSFPNKDLDIYLQSLVINGYKVAIMDL